MKLQIKHIYLVVIPVIIAVLIFSAFSSMKTDGKPDASGNEKIIKFSHNIHKDIAECDLCHVAVKTSKTARNIVVPITIG